MSGHLSDRLLAVPFKIVTKAREIAERKRKTGANERRERGERREEEKKGTAILAFTGVFRLTLPTIR